MSLQDDIVDLLRQNGPMEREFIAIRLCVASNQRLDAALLLLIADGQVERFDHGQCLRIPGDQRKRGAGNLMELWRDQRRVTA